MITLQNVHYSYLKRSRLAPWKVKSVNEVLRGIDLLLNDGEIFGLIGPNGAGKSTLAKVVLGIYSPTVGYVLNDQNREVSLQNSRWRHKIGYISGAASKLFNSMDLREHLAFYRKLYNNFNEQWVQERLDYFGLEKKFSMFIPSLSFGERIKFETVITLATNPSFLVLDEPTVGLDPIAIDDVRIMIKDYVQTKGATALLTSHNLADITAICERGAFLSAGRLTEGFQSDQIDAFNLENRYRAIFGSSHES